MKRKGLLSIIFIAMLLPAVNSQEITADWSNIQLYDDNFDGFFSSFEGFNSKYIYAKFMNIDADFRHPKKVKLFAFDKQSMDKVAAVPVLGFRQNKGSAKEFRDLEPGNVVVFENIIYLFRRMRPRDSFPLFICPELKPILLPPRSQGLSVTNRHSLKNGNSGLIRCMSSRRI